MPLFKYAAPDRVDLVQNLTIRFSPPSEFNDPFELLPDTKIVETREWIEAAMRGVVPNLMKLSPDLGKQDAERMFLERYHQSIPTHKRSALETVRETARVNRILSLSKVAPDDPGALLLWAHYTKNHSGMVFEFDDTHAWVRWHDHKNGDRHNRVDVLYRQKRSGWNRLEPEKEFLYTKSEHWFYEQEVRLMRFAGDKDFGTSKDFFGNSSRRHNEPRQSGVSECMIRLLAWAARLGGLFRTRSKVDGLVSFPPDLLRSVTLGVNNTSEKAVRDALNANSALSHVVLRKAELHPDEFRLGLTVLPR